MKVNFSLLVLIASAAGLASCQSFEAAFESGGRIHRVSVEAARTRCAEGDGEMLFSTPVPTASGDTLYLTAYLSDIEDAALEPETRGYEATTANIKDLYGAFRASVYNADGTVYESPVDPLGRTEGTVPMADCVIGASDGGWAFVDSYYWPEDGSKALTFCSFAPADAFGEGKAASVPVWDVSNGSLSFNYTMPRSSDKVSDALMQKDILLAVDSYSKSSMGGNIGVHFQHPLVAVKFLKGGLENVTLEYISLNNIHGSGTATFRDGAFTWSNLAGRDTCRQVFNAPVNDIQDTKPFDGTGEKTFFVIPQDLDEQSEIAIYIQGNLHPEVLQLKTLVDNIALTDAANSVKDKDGNLIYQWSHYAGKQISFRITAEKINHVSVAVTDDIVAGDNGFPRKQNIQITNTGRSDIYIRATLVGGWENKNGEIITEWNETGPSRHGVFSGGLLGGAESGWKTGNSDWIQGADGFFYYKRYIPVGGKVSKPLFDYFQITERPSGSGTDDENMTITQLRLTIMVQAVVADENSSKLSAITAWGASAADYLTTTPDIQN